MRKVLLCLIFIACFAVPAFFSVYDVDPHHDGAMFKPAWDLLNGNMLFKDTYSQYGAFTVLLQALAMALFGKYLIVLKLLTAVFYGMIGVLLYKLNEKILPGWINLLGIMFFICLAPYYIWTFHVWSSVYALFFQLLAVYHFASYLETGSRRNIFQSGIAAAFTFWFRQPVGIFLFAALSFFAFVELVLSREKKKNALDYSYFFIGFAAFILIVLVWLSATHALKDWWKQSIVMAYSFGSGFGTGIKRILWSLFPEIGLLWSILPISAIAAYLWYIRKRFILRLKKPEFAVMGVLAAAGLASWLQYYPVTCYRHVYWGGIPLIGCFLGFIYMLLQGRKPKILVVSVLAVSLVFLPEICFRINKAESKLSAVYYQADSGTILKGMKLSEENRDIFADIKSAYGQFKAKGGIEFVNMNPDALFLLYLEPELPSLKGSGFKPYVRQLYAMEQIYPGYFNSELEFIRVHSPMILARPEFELPKGYFVKKELRNGFKIYWPEKIK